MNTQKNSRTAKRESAYDKMEDYLTERLDFEVIYKIANSPNGMQLKELVAAFQEEWEETSGVKKILGCVVNRFVLYYANVKKGCRENGECIRTT